MRYTLCADAAAVEAAAADLDLVDAGLDAHNHAAAPLQEVQPLAVLVYGGDDLGTRPLGGARGRTWGRCAELQLLWVDPAWRRRGLGAELVQRFEAGAAARGVELVYLETFSFQAPKLYAALGYTVATQVEGLSPGVVKYWMHHRLTA